MHPVAFSTRCAAHTDLPNLAAESNPIPYPYHNRARIMHRSTPESHQCFVGNLRKELKVESFKKWLCSEGFHIYEPLLVPKTILHTSLVHGHSATERLDF